MAALPGDKLFSLYTCGILISLSYISVCLVSYTVFQEEFQYNNTWHFEEMIFVLWQNNV